MIFVDSELIEVATTRKFRIVQNEGSRTITRNIVYYDLSMIIAVGFKVNSERAVQFRKRVNQIASEHTNRKFLFRKKKVIQFTSFLIFFLIVTESNLFYF